MMPSPSVAHSMNNESVFLSARPSPINSGPCVGQARRDLLIPGGDPSKRFWVLTLTDRQPRVQCDHPFAFDLESHIIQVRKHRCVGEDTK
jgi:hypothetical protein